MIEMFQKIRKIVEALGIDAVQFKIRRPELLEDEKGFKEIHARHKVEYKISRGFSTSYGNLAINEFISFLEDYHRLLDLSTVLIDLESVIINPMFL